MAEGVRMEIGLDAEYAGLSSLDETLGCAQRLGLTRLELSTGGQNSRPFLDVDALLTNPQQRRELLHKLAGHGLTLSALNISAFSLLPKIGATHSELTLKTMQLAGELG